MNKDLEILLVTKGHIFEREPFFKMIDDLKVLEDGTTVNWTHVEQPAAGALLHPQRAAPYDAIVFYDMPGVTFTRSDPPFAHFDPSEQYKEDFMALVESGKGMVFMHHAIASWPSWPEFAEVIGGRFHFLPGELDGRQYPGSGFRFRVPQTISVVDESHPIVDGVESEFSIVDEAYLFPVLEDKVQPLLRSDFNFVASEFEMGGIGFEDHPPGSNLVGWTKRSGNSDIAYLQLGHGPEIYFNANFRRLLSNSVKWASQKSKEQDHDRSVHLDYA